MKQIMKRILAITSLGVMTFMFLFPVETAIGATASGNIVGFEITAPTTAKVNEAIDVTVRAIDKDKNTVTGYRGSIIFVSANMGDTVPSPGKAIAFSAEDAGQKKFSKGVVFKSAGKQTIYVSDVSDDISGEVTVTVEAGSTNSTDSTEQVTIITPENNAKVASDIVMVSGNARKNSKITLQLNGQDAGSAITDENGLFTKTLSGITQSKNILVATLLDANNTMIGKSRDVTFEKVAQTGGYYNTTVSPGTTVTASSTITFTIEADPGMTSANLGIDGAILEAKETQPGKYSVETVAPQNPGSYPISVNLTSSLGQIISKTNVLSLTVSPAIATTTAAKFENVKLMTEGTKAVFTFGVKDAPADLAKFKIGYGESADSLREEAVTYETGKIMTGGLYSWYIPNLKAGNLTFKIFGMRADGTLIDGLASEPISGTIGQATCSIANVGAITVDTNETSSILSWQSVTGALSYNIYKVSASGDYTFFQNVQDTKYVLNLSKGDVKHEDFAIKALCDKNTESVDYSKASHVQTGPGAILLAVLVIVSGILGALAMRRKTL